MYIVWPSLIGRHNFYTSRGVPVALVLTTSLNLRDSNTSNPKRSENAFSMYVSRPPVITQRAFSIQKGHCKNSKSILTSQTFERKNAKIILPQALRNLFFQFSSAFFGSPSFIFEPPSSRLRTIFEPSPNHLRGNKLTLRSAYATPTLRPCLPLG